MPHKKLEFEFAKFFGKSVCETVAKHFCHASTAFRMGFSTFQLCVALCFIFCVLFFYQVKVYPLITTSVEITCDLKDHVQEVKPDDAKPQWVKI